MKKAFAIVAAASLVAAGASALSVRGNGTVVDRSYALSGFTGVISTSVEEVSVEFGREFAVIVTLDENLHELYDPRVVNGMLVLGFKPGASVQGPTKLKVRIVMPSLSCAALRGAGSIRIGGGFKGRAFDIDISGAGEIDADLDVDKLAVSVSGTGTLRLAGVARDCGAVISGAGSISARSLKIQSARVTISGTGSAELSVSRNLDAVISGMGTVTYHGEPTVKQRITGLGRVVRG